MSKTTTATESLQGFGALMRATSAEGVVDAKTKELITLALTVYSKCGPCLEVHWKKALDMGITEEEIEESVWCAIAMGGAPVKMFYTTFKESLN